MSLEHSPGRESAHAFAAYTIPEFCVAHRIGRSALYKLWTEGNGPRRIQVGAGRSSKVLISVEAAADWRRDREAATNQPNVKVTAL